MKNAKPSSVNAALVLAASSIVSILAGIIKIKIAALFLGPAGVGIIGLFQQVISTGGTIFGMGLATSGAREIAASRADLSNAQTENISNALLAAVIVFAVTGATAIWFLDSVLIKPIVGAALTNSQIGLLAMGVAFTIAALYPQAIINGRHQIFEFALLTISTGMLSMLFGIAVIVIFKEDGILLYVLVMPLTSLILGLYFIRPIEGRFVILERFPKIYMEAKKLVGLGLSVMLSGAVVSIGYLAIRSLLQIELGSRALGLFTAAMLIVQYNLTFLFSATTADYMPRLTGVLSDQEKANNLINEQIQISLLFAGSICLFLLSSAPYLLSILYSEAFVGAVDLMRALILGAFLMAATQPLGFALLASGKGRAYFIIQTAATVVFVSMSIILLPYLGVLGVGVAYIAMHVGGVLLSSLTLRRTLKTIFKKQTVVMFFSGVSLLIGFQCISFYLSAKNISIVGLIVASGYLVVMLRVCEFSGNLPRKIESIFRLSGVINLFQRK